MNSTNTLQGLPMAEFSPWIKKLGPSFKEALVPLVSLASFPITKSKWKNLSFVLLPTFGFLLDMFFTSMLWRYPPLLKNLMQLQVNPKLALLFFPPFVGIFFPLSKLFWVSPLTRHGIGACLTSWTSVQFFNTSLG